MSPVRALVLRTWEDFARNTVRLMVQDATGAVIQGNGTWYRAPDEAASTGDPGILLPLEVVEAIAAAIAAIEATLTRTATDTGQQPPAQRPIPNVLLPRLTDTVTDTARIWRIVPAPTTSNDA